MRFNFFDNNETEGASKEDTHTHCFVSSFQAFLGWDM